MSGPRKRRAEVGDRDAGLTLIELLVALGLLALITLVLVGALRSGRIALERTEQMASEASLTTARSFLRNLISQARPIELPGGPKEPVSMLAGTAQSLKLISGHAAAGQYAGLYVNELHARRAKGSPRRLDLWITQELYRPTQGKNALLRPEPESVLLLRGVSGVTFAYFGSQSDGDPPAWTPEWNDRRRLPRLVSIAVRFPAKDPRRWPPLVVALPLAMN